MRDALRWQEARSSQTNPKSCSGGLLDATAAARKVSLECSCPGYITGSGWKDYLRTGEVCGHKLAAGLKESEQLPAPIFTPATKAEEGHDENISEARMREILGEEDTARLRDISLRLYTEASRYARTRGIIIADTKFEFGRDKMGRIIMIDEGLMPGLSTSGLGQYEAGKSQPSFDKQFGRPYLETVDGINTAAPRGRLHPQSRGHHRTLI